MGASLESHQVEEWSPYPDPWPRSQPIGSTVSYPLGAILLRQGQPVRSVFLIDRGVVKMIRTEANGRQLITAFRSPGWLLGAAAVILGGNCELTAQCATESEVRAIPAADFQRIHASEPSVAAWLHRMLARDVREQATRLGVFLLEPAPRLKWLLGKLARDAAMDRNRLGHRRVFPIRQHDIAAAIGTSRETVSRLLGDLEEAGEIERTRGWIRLTRAPGP